MKKLSSLLASFNILVVLGSSASAQTNLQNTAPSLQPQAGQTQTTQSLQDQTAHLQTNNPGLSLSNLRTNSLGVVSDPKQTTPEAVAIADPNLKTDLTKHPERSNVKVFLALLLVFFATAITYWVYRNYYQLPSGEVAETTAEEAPKPQKKKKSTATKNSKKRKSKKRY